MSGPPLKSWLVGLLLEPALPSRSAEPFRYVDDQWCTVSKPSIAKRTGSVTFSVTGITHGTLTYDPSSNTDPDGDSNGTTIVVTKP